jgi:hypothetical protein
VSVGIPTSFQASPLFEPVVVAGAFEYDHPTVRGDLRAQGAGLVSCYTFGSETCERDQHSLRGQRRPGGCTCSESSIAVGRSDWPAGWMERSLHKPLSWGVGCAVVVLATS